MTNGVVFGFTLTYSKYVADRFDPAEKAKRRAEVFPQDCEKAFDMGIRFVKRQKNNKVKK